MTIRSQRAQQAIYAAARSMNRAAGAGGGSGLVGGQVLADIATGSIFQTFTGTSPVDITNSTGTFSLPRQTSVLILVSVSFAVTAGIDFAYVELVEDGAVIRSAIAGDGPKGYYTASIFDIAVMGAGTHTVKLQGICGAAGTSGKVLQAEVAVFQLLG
jgi:hypothetical protein